MRRGARDESLGFVPHRTELGPQTTLEGEGYPWNVASRQVRLKMDFI
jgi:hypothetical protein